MDSKSENPFPSSQDTDSEKQISDSSFQNDSPYGSDDGDDSIVPGTDRPPFKPWVKHSIDEMRAIAEHYGGSCLSKQYLNNYTPLKWRCRSGHTFQLSLKMILREHWCGQCKHDYRRRLAETKGDSSDSSYRVALTQSESKSSLRSLSDDADESVEVQAPADRNPVESVDARRTPRTTAANTSISSTEPAPKRQRTTSVSTPSSRTSSRKQAAENNSADRSHSVHHRSTSVSSSRRLDDSHPGESASDDEPLRPSSSGLGFGPLRSRDFSSSSLSSHHYSHSSHSSASNSRQLKGWGQSADIRKLMCIPSLASVFLPGWYSSSADGHPKPGLMPGSASSSLEVVSPSASASSSSPSSSSSSSLSLSSSLSSSGSTSKVSFAAPVSHNDLGRPFAPGASEVPVTSADGRQSWWIRGTNAADERPVYPSMGSRSLIGGITRCGTAVAGFVYNKYNQYVRPVETAPVSGNQNPAASSSPTNIVNTAPAAQTAAPTKSRRKSMPHRGIPQIVPVQWFEYAKMNAGV